MTPHARRLIAVWPRTAEDISSLVVDRKKGVLWPRTGAQVVQDEPVLLELRLGHAAQRCVLRATTRFTVPERRGPMFVVDPRDRAAFEFLAAGGVPPAERAHVRFPVALHGALRRLENSHAPRRATILDISSSGARLVPFNPSAEDEPLVAGEPITLELANLPRTTASTLVNARVVGARGDAWVVSFADRGRLWEHSGWHKLRHMLRIAVETGRFRGPA
jgi:hypothetical protein